LTGSTIVDAAVTTNVASTDLAGITACTGVGSTANVTAHINSTSGDNNWPAIDFNPADFFDQFIGKPSSVAMAA